MVPSPAASFLTESSSLTEGGMTLLSLVLYGGGALALIALLLGLTWVLGQRTGSEYKDLAYESGVAPSGPARLGAPVPFYLVAIFFIVFDLEAVFIVTWAVAYDLLGWAGFFQIAFFILLLFLGLVYLWKKGGLDWGSRFSRSSQGEGR